MEGQNPALTRWAIRWHPSGIGGTSRRVFFGVDPDPDWDPDTEQEAISIVSIRPDVDSRGARPAARAARVGIGIGIAIGIENEEEHAGRSSVVHRGPTLGHARVSPVSRREGGDGGLVCGRGSSPCGAWPHPFRSGKGLAVSMRQQFHAEPRRAQREGRSRRFQRRQPFTQR